MSCKFAGSCCSCRFCTTRTFVAAECPHPQAAWGWGLSTVSCNADMSLGIFVNLTLTISLHIIGNLSVSQCVGSRPGMLRLDTYGVDWCALQCRATGFLLQACSAADAVRLRRLPWRIAMPL
jgi:hypothetical protein